MESVESYASYSDSHDDPRFSEWLRTGATDQWDRMLDHRFISECTDGQIDPAVYSTYLEQEYAFVRTAAVSLGYAIANAPSFEQVRQFAEALHSLVTDQREYFADAFTDLGIKDWQDPEPLPETRHLRDVVYRGATAPGYAESLAPMVAAEWLYATWCHRAATDGSVSSDSLVGEWISLHDDAEFQVHAEWLREEIDRVGPALSPERQRDIAYLFERTLELEVAFHTAPYEAAGQQ